MSELFRSLFSELNVELPVITKLLLSPLSRVVVPTVLVALIVKELGLRERPILNLALNALGLICIVVIHEFFVFAGISPMLELVNNLGG